MHRAIVVGAGFSGAVVARVLAEAGYKVTVYEKRDAIGGNCFDYTAENGVLVQKYGPHLFHTRSDAVMAFLRRFAVFFPYRHHVLGSIDGRLVPVPFNLTSLKILFPPDAAAPLRDALVEAYGYGARVPIARLRQSGNPGLRELGAYIYEKLYLHYTQKQWRCWLEDLDPEVGGRVPVHISDADGYFSDPFQCMPAGGFTALFRNMLNHPGITVRLSTDALELLRIEGETLLFNGAPCDCPVVWTGCLDQLLGYTLGALPYRSLAFRYENLPDACFQSCGVVNYPGEEAYTRIIEFKYFTAPSGPIQGTTIAYETPCDYNGKNIPYYPVPQRQNHELYGRYRAQVSRCRNLYLTGRLAEYRYCNMDEAVQKALDLSGRIVEENR